MKKKFINFFLSFFQKYQKYSEEDIEKLRYGIEGIYLSMTKLIIVIVLAIILGIIKEVLILLLLFNIIRFTGFGFHAEKSYQCLFISTFNFVVLPKLFLSIDISFLVFIIIAIVSELSFILFAPADTIKRPLPNKKKRIIRKSITVIIGAIYLFTYYYFKELNIRNLFLCANIIQTIVINPLTYKLFKQPYNNYKNLS